MSAALPTASLPVLSPSQLNRLARDLLEASFADVWVEGEISGFTRAASGHWYFQIKDARAQLRAAMFRNANLRVARVPANGDRVLLRGRISLFEARGDFQFLVEQMQPAGLGEILLAFEALKARLGAEGLFEASRKRPLPAWPRRLHLVTSPHGAAVHDVLSILRRRWPALQVCIFESLVQGEGAAAELRAALAAAAAAQPPADLCLLTRGGGAREDLAAFDDEALARAIAAHPVPVVSAVGHETDVCIADLVADLRAATPSAAAELISPDGPALRQRVDAAGLLLARAAQRALERPAQRLDRAALRLQSRSPQARLQQWALAIVQAARRLLQQGQMLLQQRHRQLAQLQHRLALHSPARRLQQGRQQVGMLGARLLRRHPGVQIERHGERLAVLAARLQRRAEWLLERRRQQLRQQAAVLGSLGPQAVLARGYALLFDADSGRLLAQVAELPAGRRLRLRLQDGEAGAIVTPS